MVYFDNAATTYPKPGTVPRSVFESFRKYPANPGRSGHALSLATSEAIFRCRETVSGFFGDVGPENVVFTQNCTHALNIGIKGVMQDSGHIITSCLEHNAVIRPIYTLHERFGVSYDTFTFYPGDTARTIADIRRKIRSDTKMIVCTHASNVCGMVLPIAEIAALAHENGLVFMLDAAQSAGMLPIDMKAMQIDLLAAPGHKGLYGPTGSGVLVSNGCDKLSWSLIEGGTGSLSMNLEQPDFLPDMFESGTLGVCSIAGLEQGVRFVQRTGVENICRHETRLAQKLYDGLAAIPGVQLYAPRPILHESVPVVCFNLEGMDSETVTQLLNRHQIAVRGGLHCAPLAHAFLGTQETGAVRASLGYFNTQEQVAYFLSVIQKIRRVKNDAK